MNIKRQFRFTFAFNSQWSQYHTAKGKRHLIDLFLYLWKGRTIKVNICRPRQMGRQQGEIYLRTRTLQTNPVRHILEFQWWIQKRRGRIGGETKGCCCFLLMIGKLKHADMMIKRTSLLRRKAENSGIQMSRRRLNHGMGRRGAGGRKRLKPGTNTAVTEEERIIGEGREELSESRAATMECVGGFD